MTKAAEIKSVSIVGVGLIGASFALALSQNGFKGTIVGVSSPSAVEAGVAIGAISKGVSLEEAAATSDLIYLAQPVDRILQTLEACGGMAGKGCLITDAGSTKAAIVQKAFECVRNASFLGGHPMAGKEQRGADAADADLFEGRPYVLCPAVGSGSLFEPDFRNWLLKIGARPLEMSPAMHDSTVALTSHLPQLLATALAETLAQSDNGHLSQVFGPGLIDMTRLAMSSPDLWLSILATNRTAIIAALEEYVEVLARLKNVLGSDELRTHFQISADYSQKLRKLSFTR